MTSPFPGGCALSNSENKRKRELECLRLASDLTRIGRDTLNPDLRALRSDGETVVRSGR